MNNVIVKQQRVQFVKPRQEFNIYQFHYDFHKKLVHSESHSIQPVFRKKSYSSITQQTNNNLPVLKTSMSECQGKSTDNDNQQCINQLTPNVLEQENQQQNSFLILNNTLIYLENVEIYMIHHLLNNSEFSKQDFLNPVSSQPFSELFNLYDEELHIFKIEVILNEYQFKKIKEVQSNIQNILENSKQKGETLVIEQKINNQLKTVILYCSLELILKAREQQGVKQVGDFSIQDVIHYVLENLNQVSFIVNPQYLYVKSKSQFQVVQPCFWIQQIQLLNN